MKFVIDKLTDTEVNVVEKDQAVRAVLSNVEVSTFTGLLTTVFHLPFLVQVKLLPGHLNLYLFHEIFKKILKRVSIIRGCDLTCLLVHSELLPGNLTTHRKIVHLKISSECTYIQSSNFFSKHLGADVRLWLLM